MPSVPKDLKIAAEKAHGPGQTRPVKVRRFLSWFGAKRRGSQVEIDIRAALKKVKLFTMPDFMTAHIEERVRLCPVPMKAEIRTRVPRKPLSIPNEPTPAAVEHITVIVSDVANASETQTFVKIADPTPRLGTLFGGQKPVSVRRDDSVRHAVTLMLKHDFSQLPVMSSSRQVEGLISWKSIGKAIKVHNNTCESVKDCIDTHVEILRWDKPLWEAIKTIADKDVVMIKDATNEIVGIVTSYDLADQYHWLSEPFFLLGEIESCLRQMARLANFPLTTLKAAKNPQDTTREITDVSKLTFGETVRLLDDENNWSLIQPKLSRKTFVVMLKDINKIRNDVMHFSPDPLENEAIKTLRRASSMLRDLNLFG